MPRTWQPCNDRGFGGVFDRDKETDFAAGARLKSDGQDAFDRTDGAGEGEFADDDEVLELVGGELFAGGEHAEGDGQIEARAFFAEVGGREVDGGAALRKAETGVDQRGGDAIAGFFNRGVGEPDDDHEVSPRPESTSTSTGQASMPFTAAEQTFASMRGIFLAARKEG